MAVQMVVSLHLCALFNGFESVSVLLYTRLKFEFEHSFILAEDGDCALILTLARLGRIAVDHAVWDGKVAGVCRVSDGVRHEEELIGTQVKLAILLCFLKFPHFKPIDWLLLRLIFEALETELLLPGTIH